MGKSFLLKFIILCQISFVLFGCIGGGQKIVHKVQGLNAIEQRGSASPGIETIALRQTAAGNMLDFRFRVLDSETAMPFFREDIYPYLIDEKTGLTLKVTDTTKVGPMRPTSRDPRVGKVYFMFFRNPNKFIRIGDKVTVVVGDRRLEHLVVE